MRTVTLALLAGFTLGVLAPAHAADLDYAELRGPDYEPEVPLIDWNGFYFGGHGGYTSASTKNNNRYNSIANSYFSTVGLIENTDFKNAAQLGAARLGYTTHTESAGSYGVFAGFNYQFDEAVVGIEGDYTRFDQASIGNSFVNYRFTDSVNSRAVDLAITGRSSTNVMEYGTIRARGGYAIGNFLPFVTAGLAVGRANIREQVLVKDGPSVNAPYDRTISATSFGDGSMTTVLGNSGKTKTVAGFAAGAGLDVAITQNIILRGEYQYVLFDDFGGHRAHVNTFRGGAAVKF